MLFTKFRQGRNPYKNYEQVGSWLPSKKPKFKNKISGEVVTLWDISGEEVTYKKSCGSMRKTTRGNFLTQFTRAF